MNSQSDPIYERLMYSAIQIGERAASVILEIYGAGFSVQQKSDQSPVTDADLAADKLIVDALNSLSPAYPVISEESKHPSFSERASWNRFWLVDPLDGTHGFVRRSGEFTVNVALIDEHRPVVGVVCAPVDGVSYFARVGWGAYRKNAAAEVSQLSVSEHKCGHTRVVTSPSRRSPRTRRFIEALGPVEVERLGSSLKSCRVAEGKADVYPGFSRTSEWDTAAAQCVVEEAGGRLMDLQGRPLRYNSGPGLENPRFLAVGDTQRNWLAAVPDQ